MLEELARELDAERFGAARALVAELARREAQGREAYRSAPRAEASEDLLAAQECLLALERDDPASAYYRLTDRRSGSVGDVTLLCLDAVARALRARKELLLAAAAWSEAPAAEFDAELEDVLLELRIDRFALDEHVARAAAEHWQRALEREPDDAVGWACLAVHARALSDEELAELAAKRAIDLDPSLPDPHLVLAELCEERGNTEGARRALERGSEHTADPALWTALGEVLERGGDPRGARRAFERALEPDMNNAAALEGRRRVLRETEDWDALAEHLARMIALSTDLDQAELLARERHRICIEHLGLGDQVLEERREAARERRRALAEYDRRLAEGLEQAPRLPERRGTGSPLWVLAGVVAALALLGLIAVLTER